MLLTANHHFSLGKVAQSSPSAIEVGYLLVGGGGNGGIGAIDAYVDGLVAGGGGGGGGQCLTGFINLQRNTTYPINICLDGSNASRGQTTFAGLTALTGGNGGGAYGPPQTYDGGSGGGGGGGGFNVGNTVYGVPVRSGGPGNLSAFNATTGSYGSASLRGGGGGGSGSVFGSPTGAREPGAMGTNVAGWGGNPVVFRIASYTIIVGAGGGGATLYQSANRGQGGIYNFTTKYGGDGAYFTTFGNPQSGANRVNATNAPYANSGSGGGGTAGQYGTPGYGSSGRVVIFYPGAARATVTGANQSTVSSAGYTIHFFYAAGTISFSS